MTERACRSCDFWDADRDRRRGWCRFNPPVQVHAVENARDGSMRIISNWPPTDPEWWCGRYAPAPPPSNVVPLLAADDGEF